MEKKIFENQTALFPKPTVLVGAHVDGRPNFLTIALVGFICGDPPVIAIGVRPIRHTFKGIVQNMTFSVNIPSVDMVRATDYCGIVSGQKIDKISECGFTVFYGRLKDAPLIEQCSVNMECEVLHILELGSHHAIIGKVAQTHVSRDCLTDGEPDIRKINPIAFSREKNSNYYAMGGLIAKAFHIGLELKRNIRTGPAQ